MLKPAFWGLALLAALGALAVVVGAWSPRHAPAQHGPSGHAPPGSQANGAPGTGVLDPSPRGGTPASPQPPASIPLNGGWQFLPDPGNVGLRRHWGQGATAGLPWSPVAIPNDFNPALTQASYAGTVGWYQIRFTGPLTPADRSWTLYFEQVRRHAEVWLNGRELGTNSESYVPFSFHAAGLRPGAPNLLVVRVDNVGRANGFPEDWWNWGGITEPVTLQPVGRVALAGLGVMPSLGCSNHCGDVVVEGTLRNQWVSTLHPAIVVKIRSPDGSVITSRHDGPSIHRGASARFTFRMPVPVHGAGDLWSPQSPALYQVQVQTVVSGRVEQADALKVGMRTVKVRGGILYLNGHRLWLHGAAIHEDMPGRGAALTDGDIDTIVSELRSAGANITRTHYLLSERLLEALDAAGIMVWTQPPVDHADLGLQSASGRTHALALLKATILGTRSHPSAIVESVGNELSPTADTTPGTRAYLEQAIPLARKLDPTAMVALDTYCYTHFPAQRIYSKLDVVGISDYFGWYRGRPGHSIADFSGLEPFLKMSHARYPGQAIVVSEFGAEGLYHGSTAVKGTFEFQTNYLQETLDVLDRLPFMNGSIYWTLREFAVSPGWVGGADLPKGYMPGGLHHKGLIAYDGSEKPVFSLAAKAFSDPPSFAR